MISGLDWVLFARPKAKDWQNQPAEWCEEKLDGHRITIFVEASGIRAFGRKETFDLWPDLSYLVGLQQQLSNVPLGTVLDGELLAADAPASEIKHRIKQQSQLLEFRPFAMPVCKGQDQRHGHLQDIRKAIESFGFSVPNRASFYPDYKFLASRAASERLEGYVLKGAHYALWYKVKPVRTLDALVTGFELGRGKNANKIGSLIASLLHDDGQWRVIANVGTGLSDEMRAINPCEFLDKVIEIQYDSVGARGQLRFPVFYRMREDKHAHECTTQQL